MENQPDRLAKLAESASAQDREQINRIIRSTNDATDTARKTAEIMKRMMSRAG
jgi:hypothetical protein